MHTRRHTVVRAGFLLASLLTLGCQSLAPPGAGLPGPFYAKNSDAIAAPAAPVAVAPAAPVAVTPARTDLRQVADWPATGSGDEPVTQWRPVQRPGELPAQPAGAGSAWNAALHVGESALVSTPIVTPQPTVLSEGVRNPALASMPPQPLSSPGPLANGTHRPTFQGGHAVMVPPGHAPYETKQISLPPYRVGPPDILLVESTFGVKEVALVRGQHLVKPDGTIALSIYGSVYVNGMTTEQIREAVARLILARTPEVKGGLEDVIKNTSVDVLAYNSQFYYVITDGAGLGQQVVAIPFTGRETVLDSVAKINGLSPVSSKKHIWVARRSEDGFHPGQKLPVDWVGITERTETRSNYQIMPGDRVFVQSDPVRRFDTNLGKFLSPVERLFGVTLLSSQAINSIRSGSVTGVR